MNKRIEALAKSCHIETYGVNGELLDSSFDYEKFAELIVKECANYINHRTEDWDSNLRWIFNDGSGYMEVDVDSLLNEHFGVEEW